MMITMIACGIIGIPMVMFGAALVFSPFHWADGLLLLILGWSISAVIPAKIAKGKGRSFGKWWLYGVAVFPIALVHAIATKETDTHRLFSGSYKKCPYCAEVIKKEASVCRYCGRDLPEQEHSSPVDYGRAIAEMNKENKDRFKDDKECPMCHGICSADAEICPYCNSKF